MNNNNNNNNKSSGIKIKVKGIILTIKNLADFKYWKSVYPNTAIVL